MAHNRSWRPTEAQRSYVYAVAIAVMPLLVGYGLVTEDKTVLWVGLLGAVLQTGPLTLARSRIGAAGLDDTDNIPDQ